MEERIIGEKIYLRHITANDTDEILKIRNSESVVKNFIYRKPITVEEHLNWLNNKVFKGDVVQFVICDLDNDTIYGSAYLQHFNNDNLSAESGIFLLDKCVGRGIGSEAYKLLIKYSFEVLKLHKVRARVLSFNDASIKLHLKSGYTQEAYFKDELILDGKYVDEVFFGIINQ